MRLTEVLKPQCIKNPLQSTNPTDAMGELLDLLVSQGSVSKPDAVMQALLERESIRTTGIGSDVAIPHCRSVAVDELALAVGRAPAGIDWKSIDGRTVRLVFLVCAPPAKNQAMIGMLAAIARLTSNGAKRGELLNAETALAMYEIISKE